MNWILIVITLATYDGGNKVEFQTFATKATCNVAADYLKKHFEYIDAVCVERGIR
jgi:hypothetical protein